MGSRQVLTTRSIGDAESDTALLKERGVEAIAAPMLEFKPLDLELPDASGFDAVVLTSRNAASVPGLDPFHSLKCYCVGGATAQAAKDAGFTDVETGPGDAEGLASYIDKLRPDRLLWASGIDTATDLKRELAPLGVEVERVNTYEMALVDDLPPGAESGIRNGDVGAVLVYSARAGGHFRDLLERSGLESYRKQLELIAISSRVAGLCGDGWHTITVAERPDNPAMMEAAIHAIERGND